MIIHPPVTTVFKQTNTVEEFAIHLGMWLQHGGLHHFAYTEIQAQHLAVVTNYPSEWQHRYHTQGYAQVDPVHQAEHWMPHFWCLETFDRQNTRARQFVYEAADFNIQHGLTIPLTYGTSLKRLFTVTAPEAALLQNKIKDLYQWAILLQAKKRALLHQQLYTRLSVTEQKVLQCKMQGLLNKNVAAQLRISARTVHFHLKNIRHKLNLRTIEEAIALWSSCHAPF